MPLQLNQLKALSCHRYLKVATQGLELLDIPARPFFLAPIRLAASSLGSGQSIPSPKSTAVRTSLPCTAHFIFTFLFYIIVISKCQAHPPPGTDPDPLTLGQFGRRLNGLPE